MPRYTYNGKTYNVPDNQVAGFLSRKPSAKPLEENTPIMTSVGIGTPLTKTEGSIPRESNIPKPTDTTIAKSQPAEDYTPQSAGFTPMVAPTVPKIDTKLASPTEFFATKSNEQVIVDTLRSDFARHIADPAVQFENALNVYRDSGQYERDKATEAGEQKLPPIAQSWLDNNKVDTSKSYQGALTKKLATKNTPEQIDLVNRFIANSQEGRDYAAEYAEQVKVLDDQISALEAKIEDAKQNAPITTRSQYVQTSSGQYGASGSWKDIEVPENEDDINAANTQLAELKMLKQAVEDGDRSAFGQFFGELGRRAGTGVMNIATLGVSDPMIRAGVNRALQDEDNVLTKEATDILGQWQTLHANDRSIAQDIANGTYDSLAFMAQYAVTGGAASAITKGAATAIAGKLGGTLAAQAVGKMGEMIGGAFVRTALSPSTLAGAYELNTQNPGSFLDAYSQMFTQNLVEYASEGMGAAMPGGNILGRAKGRLGRALGRVGEYTGVQGVGTEYLEEQFATLGHSITQDGQGDWADFVDPRNQLVTLGSVAIMQLPNVTISAGGYAAGKAHNVMQTRSIRKGYNRTSENMTLQFGRNAAEMMSAVNEQIDADPETAIPSLMGVLTEDAAMNDRQKDAIVKYALARTAMNGLDTAKTEEVEAAAQSVAPLVEQNVNPQTGSIMTATIAGMDSPAQIVGGNIVRREDGTIDREQSDKQIYYTDAEGNRQVTSIDFVEEVNDDIPAADAVAQMTEMATAPIIARQENDEVRQYEVGEMARAKVNGNTVVGQISGTDATGNYIVEVETPNGIVQMPVEPRQIINEDNIRGVENGSEILYMDENGNQAEGVAVMNPDLYLQGMIGLESGDIVPIADVVGLASEWRQTTATNNTAANTETVPQSAPVAGETAPSGQAETQAMAEQSGTQTAPTVNIETIVANAPKQKDGTLDYDALMETDPEAFAALYESEEGAEETRAELETVSGNIGKNIASAQKQLNAADSINKRKAARAKIASLTDQKSRIDRIINERYTAPATEPTNTAAGTEITTPGGTVVEAVEMPANARVENPAVENAVQTPAKPRKLTPRQEFVANTIPTNLYEAALLHMMGGGQLNRSEFMSRTGYGEKDLGTAFRVLSDNGVPFDAFESDFYATYRPEEYDAGFESSLDEITQAVNDYIEDRGATDALKQRFGNADTWIDPDGEARAEYEAERAEEDAVIENEIFSQEIGERAVELLTFAKELEIPETEIDASANLVSLIEQYQNGTTETEIHPRSGSTGESGDSVSTGQGERDTQETGTSGQRDGREQTGGYRIPDSDTRRNDTGGLGAQTLSTAEQQVVTDATAAFDMDVADAEARLRQRRADLTAARSRIGQAYTADNQTSLFGQGETATSGNLFNVPRDYSRENVEDILVPIQQEIDALADELVALQGSRDSRIQAALDNFRSQPTILDAIAQAEAETDTNPTEAQKQAGNYKMGHVKVQGFDISIENPKGSVRSSVDENGRAWSQEMQNTYGYFGKTQSKDGDHIDVFLGDNPESGTLFVVDQVNPTTGQFDEHKVMLGFDTLEEARDAYLSNYEDGWQGLGGITGVDVETFRTWAQADGRRVKPFAEYRTIQNVQAQSTVERFKPITERRFNQVIELLRRTGLAKEIVVDHDAVQKKIMDLFGDNGTERYQVLINPREPYENTRREWTRAKILRYLKEAKKAGYDNTGKLLSYIAQFDTPEELRNHLFYHGTSRYVSGNLYPSITMSDREVEQRGGGGYGEKYWAISLSSAKNRSKNFGGTTSPYVTIYPVLLNKNAVVINMPQYGDSNNLEDGIEQLWNDGIDAVRLGNWTEESSEKEIAVLNPYAISVVHDLGQTFKQFNLGRLNNPTDEDLQDIISKAKAYVSESEEIKQSLPYPNSNGLSDREYLDKRKPITQERRARDRELIMQILHDTPTRLMATPKGDVYGFVTPDGTVYIDGSRMNANTPIHEFGHLWNSMIKESNPDLWARGSALIRESDYWRQVNDNPAYRDLSDDRKVDEALAMAIGNKGEDAFHNQDVVAYAGVKGWLWQAWEWIKSKLGIARDTNIEDMTLGDFTDLAVRELLGGKSLANTTPTTELSTQEVSEMEQIRQRAVADGTFMKAPNGQPTNLTERQWLQVRTSNFKNWFGDWEKATRIEKLRNSTPVEITGEEITSSEDLKEYRKNALEYGKSFRGNYTNADTGEVINVGLNALKEVLHHDGSNIAHIQSVAAIPAIIENGVYINTVESESVSANPNVENYDYYVTGLKIGGIDYTVKAVIANDRNGTRYYDHSLTQIEKRNLLDEVEGVSSPTRQQGDYVTTDIGRLSNTLLSDVKDKRLISILQTNSSKIVDENGEPRVVYHGSTHQFYEFTKDRGNVENHFGIAYYFTDSNFDAEENYLWSGDDLNSRVVKRTEELEEDGIDRDAAKEQARMELVGTDGGIMDVFLNLRNPIDITANGLRFDALDAYNEELDEYEENEDSMPARLANALFELRDELEAADTSDTELFGHIFDIIGDWDGTSAYDIDKAMRSFEPLMYMESEDGRSLVSNEFIRKIYDTMGFDGIIMDASNEFGQGRTTGRAMNIEDGVNHYIAFESNQIKSATDNTGEFSTDNNDIRFQSVSDVARANGSTMTEEMRNELDGELNNFVSRFREAWEDRHLAVKKFFDVLRKNGAVIAEYNDFYKQATHLAGKNDAQLNRYNKLFQEPLNKAISDLEKADFTYRDIENYVILKHGLERNEWMRRDAVRKYKEENPDASITQLREFEKGLPKDYSGITAVEAEILTPVGIFVSEFEEKAGQELIENLWTRIKGATNFALKKQLDGGLIRKQLYDELTARYEFYVPLRGHDAQTAEDMWNYTPDMGTYFVAPLMKAKGRTSRSESPFAYIFSMAQSSINAANRNTLNQTILRLAMKDKTGLMSVSKSWYVNAGYNAQGKPQYEVQSPEYSENPEQYRKNIEEFEARMEALAEQGQAFKGRKKLNIGGMFIKRSQAQQHEVHVFQNGEEYTVYINANPAVARAINGSNVEDMHKNLQYISRVSRQMSANFTTRNPIFILSNFSRDYIFSSSILAVKEDARYALQFQRNLLNSAGALQRYVRGAMDLSKENDVYLNEYILNGGKTGFSHILELQSVQRQIERDIKNHGKKNAADYTIRPLLNGLEAMNDMAENMSRLSVYITSRKQGRSVTQSISDAKEVTVNFNRSGAGGYGSQWVRPLYLFVNAGIQALANFAKVAAKNKAKTAALIGGYLASGFLMPFLAELLGGDDGREEYLKLGDWERQNNLCIYTGNGFIKIPLPHELRVFHRMGDNVFMWKFGGKDALEITLDTALGFADLLPANPTGAVDGSWADMMPDALKPFFQLAANRNFTGSRITNEWADPNKPGYLKVRTNKKGEPYAPAFLVKLAETLDTVTGGDGVKKGIVSLNPDVVNHLVRGYFGGLYTMTAQGLDVASKTIDFAKTGEFKLKVRETPLRTFYTSSDDLQVTGSGLNSRYFKMSDQTKEVLRQVKGYKEQVADGTLGIEGFTEKINGLDIAKANEANSVIKQIDKYERSLKELDGEEQREAERIIAQLKETVIEIYKK